MKMGTALGAARVVKPGMPVIVVTAISNEKAAAI